MDPGAEAVGGGGQSRGEAPVGGSGGEAPPKEKNINLKALEIK